MPSVTMSSKFQVVVPLEVRRSLGLKPGQKFEVFLLDGVLEYLPVSSPADLRGFLKGMSPQFERDEDDRP